MSITALSDLFTGTNGQNLTGHTMDVGPGWTANNGTFTIQSNKASPTAGVANNNYASNAGTANIILTCVWGAFPASGVFAAGNVVRCTDVNNCWEVVAENDATTPFVQILQRQGGTNTQRASATDAGLFNASPTATITCNGSTVSVGLSDGKSCSYSSASFNQTTTNHGIYGFTNLGYQAISLDNFLVTYNSPLSPYYYRLFSEGQI